MSSLGARPDDEAWMEAACEQAVRGLGKTAPNPAVGCVIVANGRVVGRGFHRRAGAAHAEVEALREAGRSARGATVYVTLEPCCTHGRTPPCTEALLAAGVKRVVVGCRDPNPEVSGRGARKLARAGIEVLVGVCAPRCRDIIRGFESWIIDKRPWVQLKLAASLDGRIASRTGASKWISSQVSRRRVQEMRARSGAVVVGITTVLKDDPRLTCRLRGANNPLRVILDSSLRTPVDSRVVCGAGSVLIVSNPDPPERRRRRLECAGAEVVGIDTRGRRGWRRLLAELGRRGIHEVLIEGGAQVAASALRARVVNSVTIFYNPRLIGSDGVPLVGALGVTDPAGGPRFVTHEWGTSGEDLVWTGRPE